MTGYVPREGDRIKVELTVKRTDAGLIADGLMTNDGTGGSLLFADLIRVGRVELVARAEPAWQPGDIGEHVKTGALYAYTLARHEKGFSWCTVYDTDPHEIGVWHGANALAGKLRPVRVVPVDEQLLNWPAPAADLPKTTVPCGCSGFHDREPEEPDYG